MKVHVYFLLGTSLSCFPALAWGQCVVAEDCAALGYTETSCPGNGLKCPFGNGWFCGGDEATICAENGFKYTCTGTGYSGGSGQPCGGKYKTCTCATNYTWNGSSCALSCSSSYKYTCTGTGYAGGAGSACGGKYTQCKCSSGYTWTNGSCKKALNGAQGNLYYCNGEVVAVKAPDMNFYVAMKDLGKMGWNTADSSCRNYTSCDSPKWRLPSKNQLMTIYNNKSSLNNLLSTNNGKKIPEEAHWSSDIAECIFGVGCYYYMDMSYGYVNGSGSSGEYHVRCIFY